MSLITTITQFKAYVPISGDTQLSRLEPSLAQAEAREVKTLLGADEYNALVADLTNGEPTTQKYIDLIPHVRKVLANYAMVRFVGTGNVTMSSNGMSVESFTNSDPAPKWKVAEAKINLMTFGDEAADQLQLFLEENKATYTHWAGSTANTLAVGAFITTAQQVTDAIGMVINRSLFIRLKPALARAERSASRLVSAAQFAKLQTGIAAGALTPENQELADKLRSIIAHTAVVQALPLIPLRLTGDGVYMITLTDSITHQVSAKAAEVKNLQEELAKVLNADTEDLKQFLIDNVDDYPLYKASNSYTSRPATGTVRVYPNQATNNHFGV